MAADMKTDSHTDPTPLHKPAPAFHLKDQHGQPHRLSQYKGQWVVLYFYPKDDTPGCTREACQFRDRSADFQKANAVVLGVSPDDTTSHGKFATKHQLTFPLLADPDKRTIEAYGVWKEKTLYGVKRMGVVRTTVLIDPHGRVAHRWNNVKVEGHDDAILACIDELARTNGKQG